MRRASILLAAFSLACLYALLMSRGRETSANSQAVSDLDGTSRPLAPANTSRTPGEVETKKCTLTVLDSTSEMPIAGASALRSIPGRLLRTRETIGVTDSGGQMVIPSVVNVELVVSAAGYVSQPLLVMAGERIRTIHLRAA